MALGEHQLPGGKFFRKQNFEKTLIFAYVVVGKGIMILFTIKVSLDRQTDRQTDGRTDTQTDIQSQL